MTLKIRMLACIVVLSVFAAGQHLALPARDYVPDSPTAVKIAEAVLIPVYGEKQIESERPFIAILQNKVWTVTGTLHCPDGKGGTTTICVGGTAVVKIPQQDARIISMIHYK